MTKTYAIFFIFRQKKLALLKLYLFIIKVLEIIKFIINEFLILHFLKIIAQNLTHHIFLLHIHNLNFIHLHNHLIVQLDIVLEVVKLLFFFFIHILR